MYKPNGNELSEAGGDGEQQGDHDGGDGGVEHRANAHILVGLLGLRLGQTSGGNEAGVGGQGVQSGGGEGGADAGLEGGTLAGGYVPRRVALAAELPADAAVIRVRYRCGNRVCTLRLIELDLIAAIYRNKSASDFPPSSGYILYQ